MTVNIEIFVPAYNCEKWIERCLNSILVQDYPHFNMTMVDDASTDSTGELMETFAYLSEDKVIHNATNQKMPRNLTYLREGNPDDVIFIVDGDDYLPHEHVFTEVARCFQDPDLWLMYGSYTRYPDPSWMPNPALPFPPEIIDGISYREYSTYALVYNHPLVFRRWLLNEVSDREMQDNDGNWFDCAYDHVIMMPMLELASFGHFKWNPEILYVYNEENTMSEAKNEQRMEGVRVHNTVNARAKRKPLL